MPDNKKHHYVPQYYLRRFSSDGRSVNLFNIKARKTILGASLKRQCYRDRFYGKDPEIERALGLAEGEMATLLRLVDEHRTIPPPGSDAHLLLVVTLATQMGRTKYSADAINEMTDKFAKLAFRETLMSQGIDIDKFKIGIHDSGRYALGMQAELFPFLTDLHYKLLINKSADEFVTSDNPVVAYNQFLEFHKFGSNCGVGTKGLQLFYPLDPEKMLILYDSAVYKVGSNSKIVLDISNTHDVRSLNGLQICSASDNVYFKSAGLNLGTIYQSASPYLRHKHVDVRIAMAQATDEGRSEILAGSKEDVRTNLSLSFCDVRHSARTWRTRFRQQRTWPAAIPRNPKMFDAFQEFRRNRGKDQSLDFPTFVSRKFVEEAESRAAGKHSGPT